MRDGHLRPHRPRTRPEAVSTKPGQPCFRAPNGLCRARTTPPSIPAASPAIDVRHATPDDLDAVYRIAAAGNAHHARPPMFVPYVEPNTEEDVRGSLRRALGDEGQAIFLAVDKRQPVGILWVAPPKGSPLFTPDDSVLHGDTAVLAEPRRRSRQRGPRTRARLGARTRLPSRDAPLRHREPAFECVLAGPRLRTGDVPPPPPPR